MEIERPPVFIVGMPRSGSTAFHRVLARHPEVATTTRVTRKAPVVYPALWVLARMTRDHSPGEAGSMWNRYLRGDSDVMTEADLTPEARAYYRKAVANVLKLYGRTLFVAKCPRLGLRMRYLEEIFPEARFLHLIRDARAVVRSVLERRDHAGDRMTWWDMKPEGWRKWAALDPFEAVAHQWTEVVGYISSCGARLPAERYLEIRYEDFTADPIQTMRRTAEFCEIAWSGGTLDEAIRSIRSRNAKWAGEFSPAEEAQILAITSLTMKAKGYL